MPGAANIHKLNACGLLIIKRLLIIDEEGLIIMIKVMLITMKIKMIKQASVYQDLPPFIEAELFCYHYCTCYQRMNVKVQEKRRTCVGECIYAPTIDVYCLRHVLDRA